jgi:hypothetical protein
MNIEEWLKYGWDKGFCTPPVCSAHDGVPTSLDEEEAWESGDEPCVYVVRLYANDERRAVEANSSVALWRAGERGWGN